MRREDGGSGAIIHRLEGASGPDLFLKFSDGAAAAAIVDEAARLCWLAGRVPAARIVGAVEADGCAWLLTAALPGRSAGAWLSRDPDRLARVVIAMADFLRALHALPSDDCPFDSTVAAWLPSARQRLADGLIDEDDFDPDHRGWSASAVLAQVEALAEYAQGRVVAHGDFSLGNLMIDAAGGVTGCIDVGRLGVADPYQDIAIAWRDLAGFGPSAQDQFLRAVGLPQPDAQRLLLHRSLDELF